MASSRSRRSRIVLIVVLVLAVAVLVGAAAVTIPILTHQSAGGSGQTVPTEAVSEVDAVGADGRERSLWIDPATSDSVDTGALHVGDEITVSGSGFDSAIGIYIAICGVPEGENQKPGPCIGGIPEGAEEGTVDEEDLSTVWISDDWAWRAFATQRYDDAETGSFTATITVPSPVIDGLDCRTTRCAIATRADHTASSDRVQDMLLPVYFAKE